MTCMIPASTPGSTSTASGASGTRCGRPISTPSPPAASAAILEKRRPQPQPLGQIRRTRSRGAARKSRPLCQADLIAKRGGGAAWHPTRQAAVLQRDRKSGGSGKSVSVRVDLGGPRFIKKKTQDERHT